MMTERKNKMTHLEYFYEISRIPRSSGKEEKIADYLCDFAEKHGLEYYRDSAKNVLINKPASKGYESAPAFCLQGHTDMVCEKTLSSAHDFLCDPIDVYEENGKLKAHGTTLGADDGAAVAMMLALLSGDCKAPRLQCLFTAEEETGLFGAGRFDYSLITSDYMINIDGEEEDEILSSCAGGLRVKLSKKYPVFTSDTCVRVEIEGLAGGHSGCDINKNRTNGALAMLRFVLRLAQKGAGIAFLEGGSKENAIPQCAVAVLKCDIEAAENEAGKFTSEILPSLSDDDKNFCIKVTPTESIPSMSAEDTRELCELALSLKSGVISMSQNVEGMVSTSANLGIARVSDGLASLCLSVRAEDDAEKEKVSMEYASASQLSAYTYEKGQAYPGWKFKKESKLRPLYAEAYKEITGKEIKVNAIHAGLECGLISGALPSLDIIAIGPQMDNVHTTSETMDIASFDRVFETVKLCLEKAKEL